MQAARGTSLSPGGSAPTPTARPHRRHLLVFGLVAAVAYATDQVTKVLAVEHLTGRPDVQVVGEVLRLHLTRNPGAAFSTGTGFTPVFACLAAVAVVVVLFLSRRLGSTGWSLALGFLLAGVAGNLTDRLVREPSVLHGHVIDFLMLPNWPIFNVADICINVAAGLIIVQTFRGIRLDGTRIASDDEPDAQEPDPGQTP
ncbi:signal peptidase II [Nocardioides sp. SYSU D00038]|uniref:signal peptidase II n=1 Tax=Nocardioides sp. SYSU D00038 TaxID=2812554 RepID=UPI00196888F9|nr:signal peptidase II [Nocardioides sp. SYSU D00038]